MCKQLRLQRVLLDGVITVIPLEEEMAWVLTSYTAF